MDPTRNNPFAGGNLPSERDTFDDPNLVPPDKDDDKPSKEDDDDDTSGDGDPEETDDETKEDEDDTTDDDKETDEDEDEEDGKDKEDKEEEDDDELTDEEKQLAESDQVYQKIKKESPELFKKIPELKAIIFREQRYTEVFPSVEEAVEASERLEGFEAINQEITSGKSAGVIKALSTIGKKNLETFLGNFLPTVYKEAGKDAYLGMVYPAFKQMLRAAADSKNEVLVKSAQNLNYFLFNDTDLSKDAGFKAQEENEQEDELSKREKAFQQRQFQSFAEDVVDVVEKRIRTVTMKGLEGTGISNLMQRKIAEEVKDRVDEIIKNDKRFQGQNKHLWEQAKSKGLTSRWKDSISNAYLSRAKLLIPQIRQRVLKEFGVALKSAPTKGERNRHIPASNGRSSLNGKPRIKKDESGKDDLSGLSDREILDRM